MWAYVHAVEADAAFRGFRRRKDAGHPIAVDAPQSRCGADLNPAGVVRADGADVPQRWGVGHPEPLAAELVEAGQSVTPPDPQAPEFIGVECFDTPQVPKPLNDAPGGIHAAQPGRRADDEIAVRARKHRLDDGVRQTIVDLDSQDVRASQLIDAAARGDPRQFLAVHVKTVYGIACQAGVAIDADESRSGPAQNAALGPDPNLPVRMRNDDVDLRWFFAGAGQDSCEGLALELVKSARVTQADP